MVSNHNYNMGVVQSLDGFSWGKSPYLKMDDDWGMETPMWFGAFLKWGIFLGNSFSVSRLSPGRKKDLDKKTWGLAIL